VLILRPPKQPDNALADLAHLRSGQTPVVHRSKIKPSTSEVGHFRLIHLLRRAGLMSAQPQKRPLDDLGGLRWKTRRRAVSDRHRDSFPII
jgi:hypothetical protein